MELVLVHITDIHLENDTDYNMFIYCICNIFTSAF